MTWNVLLLALALALVGCAEKSAPSPAPIAAADVQDLDHHRARVSRGARAYNRRADAWGRCEASWYGERFRGRRTSSGERFDPDQLTAAHREFAFGTIVEVELLDASGRATGTAVAVRITDRGPFPDGRCLDLTSAAFSHLAPLDRGVVPVRWRRRV